MKSAVPVTPFVQKQYSHNYRRMLPVTSQRLCFLGDAAAFYSLRVLSVASQYYSLSAITADSFNVKAS